MQKADGTPADVDLVGAMDVVALMYALGFDDETDDITFWEKRSLIEEYERQIRADERQTMSMTEPQKDTQRALAAAKLLIDGRNMTSDMGAIMTTLEGLVTLMLLSAMRNDPKKAAAMLNEGLVPGVESRLALAASRG